MKARMSTTMNADSILEMVRGLSESEQSSIAERIMAMLAEQQPAAKTTRRELIPERVNEKPDCPHCGAKASMGLVIKKGSHKGAQRYYCKKCEKYFVSTTNTVFSGSRKSASIWREFIHLTIAGKSLPYCAAKCEISYQTAFTWRHKILNAFVVNQNATMMTGNVELDEMLIPLNYKGNHIRGEGFFGRKLNADRSNSGMPRPSFERGSDNRPKSSNEKACVFCMVEDGDKSFYAAVPGVGFMNPAMLARTIKQHVDNDKALMLADNYQATKNYLEANGYRYETFYSNVTPNQNKRIPEVRGELHLQHVNALHMHLRHFLARYYGVSSKYLEHYVSLYIWLKAFCKSNQKYIEKSSVARTAAQDCYITRSALEARPAVPCCA